MNEETIENLVREVEKRRLDKVYITRLVKYVKDCLENADDVIGQKVTDIVRFIARINASFELELTENDYEQLQLASLLKHLPVVSQWTKIDKRIFEVLSQPGVLRQTMSDYTEVLQKDIVRNPETDVFRLFKKKLEVNNTHENILHLSIEMLVDALQTRKEELTSFGKYVLKQNFAQCYYLFRQTGKVAVYIELLITHQQKTFNKYLDVLVETARQKGERAVLDMMELLLAIDAQKYNETIRELVPQLQTAQSLYQAAFVLHKADTESYGELALEIVTEVYQQLDEDETVTEPKVVFEGYESSLQITLIAWLLANYGRKVLPLVVKYKTNSLKQRLQYLKVVAQYLRQTGADILMKFLFAKIKPEEDIDEKVYISKILELLQDLYPAKYQQKLWGAFETEDDAEIVALVAGVLAKLEDKTLENVRQKLVASKVNTRFLAMQTLARIPCQQATQLLESRQTKERSKRLKEWLNNHLATDTRSENGQTSGNARYLFDVFAKKTLDACLKVILANQESITTEIAQINVCYDEQEYRMNKVELVFSQGKRLQFALPHIKSAIPVHIDFIDVQDEVLPPFIEKHRLGAQKELQWGESHHLIEELYYFNLVSVLLTLPEKLQAKEVKCSEDVKIYLVTQDVEDLVEQVWADRYFASISRQLPRIFNDAESLATFAEICYKAVTPQKWMIDAVNLEV